MADENKCPLRGFRSSVQVDDQFTVVEHSELTRLQTLERKIVAFFQDIRFDGGSFIVGRAHFLTDDGVATSAAFRKAFELFEVEP